MALGLALPRPAGPGPSLQRPLPQLLGPDGQPIQADNGFLLPHYRTFAAIYNAVNRTYRYTWDEALKVDPQHALDMRRDAYIASLLQERYLPVARAKWRLKPEQPKDAFQKDVATKLDAVLRRTPRPTAFRYALMEATWYGRYGAQTVRRKAVVLGEPRWVTGDWRPVNGDKIQYDTHDAAPKIAVNLTEVDPKLLPLIQYGDRYPMLPLRTPELRERFIIHKHIPSDADYFEGEMAGGVHGVGVRSMIYWSWWLRQECLSWMLDYMQKVGTLGLLLFYYDASNPTQQAAAEAAAQECSEKNALAVPVFAGDRKSAGAELLPASTGGVDALQSIISDYFERHQERLIIGQSMSSGADNDSGLGGSGRAEFTADTKYQINAFDAENLDDSLTRDWVEPMKRLNFPEADFPIRMETAIPDPGAADKVEGAKTIVEMGGQIVEDDLRELLGWREPGPEDKALGGQAAMGAVGMPGMPGSPGQPPPGGDDDQGEDDDGDNVGGPPEKPTFGKGKPPAAPPKPGAPGLNASPDVPMEYAAEEARYSCALFALPPWLADKVRAMAADVAEADLAEGGREERPHLTALFGLHTSDPRELAEAVRDQDGVPVVLGRTSLFHLPDCEVLKIDVGGWELHQMNAHLAGRLEHDQTHPVYQPHITLAYVKKGRGAKYAGDDRLAGVPAVLTRMEFSDKRRRRTAVPLTPPAEAPGLYAGRGRAVHYDQGRWVTIGGVKGEDGKRHGGSPVFIQNGRIVKGAPSLTGKRPEELKRAKGEAKGSDDKPAAKEPTHRQELNRDKEYKRARFAKAARKEGIDPKHLHALAGEYLEHDKELVKDRTAVLQRARKMAEGLGYGSLVNLKARNAGGNLDPSKVKGLDDVAARLAEEHPAQFAGHEDDLPGRLFEMLAEGNPQPMSEEDAYETALEHLRHDRGGEGGRGDGPDGGDYEPSDDPIPFARDASGHDHDAAGLFTSGGGGSGRPTAEDRAARKAKRKEVSKAFRKEFKGNLNGLEGALANVADTVNGEEKWRLQEAADPVAEAMHKATALTLDDRRQFLPHAGTTRAEQSAAWLRVAAEAGRLVRRLGRPGALGLADARRHKALAAAAEAEHHARRLAVAVRRSAYAGRKVSYALDAVGHEHDRAGRFAPKGGGGSATVERRERAKESIRQGLAAGRKAAGVLALAAAEAGAKVEHAVVQAVAGRVDKLPPRARRWVVRGWRALMLTFNAGQEAAAEAARAAGLEGGAVERLGHTLAVVDLFAFKAAKVSSLFGVPGAKLATGVAGTVPLASSVYLAYSTARRPVKTILAARRAVAKVIQSLPRVEAPAAVHHALDYAGAPPSAGARELAERLKGMTPEAADWFLALVHAGLDATGGDLAAAVGAAADVAGRDAGAEHYDWAESDHPRGQPGNAGQFAPKGGNQPATGRQPSGNQPATGRQPSGNRGRRPASVRRSKEISRVARRRRVLHAWRNESELAHNLGGHNLPDSEPADVILMVDPVGNVVRDPAFIRHVLTVNRHAIANGTHRLPYQVHAVEVKTLVVDPEGRVRMSVKAKARKERWGEAHGAVWHTVVFDDRRGAKASGQRLYHKAGVGGFKVSEMVGTNDYAELSAMLTEAVEKGRASA